jgi:hypothetical protein
MSDLSCGCYCHACKSGAHGCIFPACSHRLGLVDKWPKRCSCGRSYTEHEWALLKFIGTMVDDDTSLELRDCPCGSTIGQEIESTPPR